MTATRTRYLAWAAAALTLVLVLVLWQQVSDAVAFYISRPTEVGKALLSWVTNPALLSYIPITLGEVLVGFLSGVVLGVLLAVLLSSSKLIADVASPFISVFNAVPKLALAPLFVLLFGIAFSSKVYFVAATVFFIPFYSLFVALQTVDRTILDHAKILGASRTRLVLDVYVPAVTASVAASARVAVSFALLAAVIAELIVSSAGIGFELSTAQMSAQPDFLIATILVIGIVGFILDRLLLLVERHFSHWKVSR